LLSLETLASSVEKGNSKIRSWLTYWCLIGYISWEGGEAVQPEKG
jgi:hypothetical protein